MSFCNLPFIALRVQPDGGTKFCCRMKSDLGNTKENTLHEIWNNDLSNQIRSDFKNNIRPDICSNCWKLEDVGGISHRMISNSYYNLSKEELIERSELFQIKTMEIATSNLCNLSCKMCYPSVSSAVGTFIIKKLENRDVDTFSLSEKSFKSFDQLLIELKSIAPHLTDLSLSGGEPFMDSQYGQILDALQEHKEHISVHIVSNLSKLKFGQFELLKHCYGFRHIALTVSIDGTKKVHEFIRQGSNLDDVLTNIKLVREQFPNITIYNNIAISALNILDWKNTINFIVSEIKPDGISHSYADGEIHIRNIPIELLKQINFDLDVNLHPAVNELQNTLQGMINNISDGSFKQLQDKCNWFDGNKLFDIYPQLLPYKT